MIVKIQHRRGAYADYDPTKVLPGELVVVQSDDPNSEDGKAIYVGTTAGDVKRIPTASEIEAYNEQSAVILERVTTLASNAQNYAQTAQTKASEANTSATNASGYADNASASATAAATSATDASSSATAASTSAGQAAGSATSASGSAGQAAGSATAASESATAAADSAEDAQEMTYTAEAWAVGTKNGIDVSPDDPQYHNNAKYYTEQAEAAQVLIAEVYDATTTYAIGDYCLHDGQLYECTTEITTPEAWTAAHWTATTVGTELNNINDDVTDLKEDLNRLGLSVVDGAINITYQEVSE